MTTIYYIFSSITFLEYFIPIVIEANKRGYNNCFLLKKNTKSYTDPFSEENKKIVKKYIKQYNINSVKIKNLEEIRNYKGIIFLVDGDIYGPPTNEALKISAINYLGDQTLKISIPENLNFWAVYHHYIDKVNISIFSNKAVIDQMQNFCKNKNGTVKLGSKEFLLKKNYENEKNLFLGNSKYDNIPKEIKIYKKFSLSPNQKICVLLFPKLGKFKESDMQRIYSYIKKMGYFLVVKTRPKEYKKLPKSLHGDMQVNSNIYPNDSLLLMKIADLCIISSSSANEEALFSKIPCIDLVTNNKSYERNKYLYDPKIYKKIENWEGISYKKFSKYVNSLERKNSNYFDKLIKRFLFTHSNSSEKYFDYLEENYPSFFKKI